MSKRYFNGADRGLIASNNESSQDLESALGQEIHNQGLALSVINCSLDKVEQQCAQTKRPYSFVIMDLTSDGTETTHQPHHYLQTALCRYGNGGKVGVHSPFIVYADFDIPQSSNFQHAGKAHLVFRKPNTPPSEVAQAVIENVIYEQVTIEKEAKLLGILEDTSTSQLKALFAGQWVAYNGQEILEDLPCDEQRIGLYSKLDLSLSPSADQRPIMFYVNEKGQIA